MTRANLLKGPRNMPAKTNRNLGTAIGPGTSKALVEPLGKANTPALTYSTAEMTAFEKAREQGRDIFPKLRCTSSEQSKCSLLTDA